MKFTCTYITVFFLFCTCYVNAQTSAFAKTVSYNYTEDSVDSKKAIPETEAKTPGNADIPKQRPAQKRAYDRQAKTFKVYPNPANNFVYLKYYGEGMITLHNASDSLIFKARVREKATVNVRKLPVGSYYFTDIKTGLKQEMIIAR